MTAAAWITILWKARPSPTTAGFLVKMRCLLLLLVLLALASHAQGTHNAVFNKRGPVTPSAEYCGVNGRVNGDIVCAPKKNDKYTIPGVMTVAWNSLDVEVAAINAVDIYLQRTDTVNWVDKWMNIANENVTYKIQLSDAWFPSRKNSSIAQTMSFQVVIVASGNDPRGAPTGSVSGVFSITQPADASALDSEASSAPTSAPASTTTKVVLSTSATTSTKQDQGDESKRPSVGFIVAGAISGVVAVAAIVSLFFLCRSRKQLKKQRSMSNLSTNSSAPMMDLAAKEFKGDSEFAVEVSSIHSTTPLANKDSISNINQRAGFIPSSPSRSNLSSSVPTVTFSPASQNAALSPTDASILSDAFRHALRKPDWENENNDNDDDEDEEDTSTLNEEERRRRKEAKQLMKMELAQEGTGLRTVQRRPTRVQIRKPSDADDSGVGDNAGDNAFDNVDDNAGDDLL